MDNSKSRLRELEAADLPSINRWRTDRETVASLGAPFRFIARAVDDAWYKSYLADRTRSVRLAVVDPVDGQHIGCANLTSIDSVARSAEFSIWIGEANRRGRGIGQSVTRQVLDHGFKDLNLNRIYLFVLRDNGNALSIYKKIGFSVEGEMREAAFKNGGFKDVIAMSILQREYRA